MNKSLRRQFLEANLEQVESFLRDTTVRLRRLERIGFESRRDEILDELKSLGPSNSANVILAFDGEPVADAPGIDAAFAGSALWEFQNVVSAIDASKAQELRDSGPLPLKKNSRLRLVGTAHGSFGFELQEADNSLFKTSLADSVASAAKLIAAAGQGDDEFMLVAADVGPRVQAQLASFLKVIKSANAVCKVVTDDAEASLDEARVNAAVERVSTTTIEDVEEHYEGTFSGVTIESRRFDHKINDIGGVIKGRVHDDVDRALMLQWDRKWSGKLCVAVVLKRTVSGRHRRSTGFTLLRIEPLIAGKRS